MYFFRIFIKELRRDMKVNPKKQLPKYLNINHVVQNKKMFDKENEIGKS